MPCLTSLNYLFVAAIGVFAACRATSPEAPPLAPVPDNAPGSPAYPTEDGGAVPTPAPLPKQPGPITARELPIPDLRAERYQLVDAGDAAVRR